MQKPDEAKPREPSSQSHKPAAARGPSAKGAAKDAATDAIKGDAAGQFAPTQSGSHNNGLASAVPRVTGKSESIAKSWDE